MEFIERFILSRINFYQILTIQVYWDLNLRFEDGMKNNLKKSNYLFVCNHSIIGILRSFRIKGNIIYTQMTKDDLIEIVIVSLGV